MVGRGYDIYTFLFCCYKTKHFYFFSVCPCFFFFLFFCEDLATLKLYRRAHERS